MVYKMLPGLEKRDHQIRTTPRRRNDCKSPRVDPKRRDRLKDKMRQRLSKRLRNMRMALYFLCIPAIILFAIVIANGIYEFIPGRLPGGRAEGFAVGAIILGLLMTFGVITDIHATRNRLERIN